jgi:hypothetical protein
MTSFQVKVLQRKFTLLDADFSKKELKYSNDVHYGILLWYLIRLNLILYNRKSKFSFKVGELI